MKRYNSGKISVWNTSGNEIRHSDGFILYFMNDERKEEVNDACNIHTNVCDLALIEFEELLDNL